MNLSISVTSSCNLDCKYCGGWEKLYHHTDMFLAYEDVCKILSIAKEFGAKRLTITGGEPFLHNKLYNILEYASELGYWIHITTNGTLINDEIAKQLSRFPRIYSIRVSIDSPHKNICDNLRGEGVFKKVLFAINNLKKYYLPVSIGMTIINKNVNDVESMVKFCIEKEISYLRITPVVNVLKVKDINYAFFEKILYNSICAIIRYKDSVYLNKLRLKTPPLSMVYDKNCSAGIGYFFIDCKKTMVPCPFIPAEYKEITKIENVSSIKDFQIMRNIMKNLKSKLSHNLRGKCGVCSINQKCMGGCLVEKATRGGSLYDEQPICMKVILNNVINKAIKKFGHKEVNKIIGSWINEMYNSEAADFGLYCMRQLPIWYIKFKR